MRVIVKNFKLEVCVMDSTGESTGRCPFVN